MKIINELWDGCVIFPNNENIVHVDKKQHKDIYFVEDEQRRVWPRIDKVLVDHENFPDVVRTKWICETIKLIHVDVLSEHAIEESIVNI